MPAPARELIIPPESRRYRLAPEPALNALHSLLMIARVDDYSGLDPWVTETAASLPEEIRRRNTVVLWGLHYAVVPDRSWPSFPAYIDHLASEDAKQLRDRILDFYFSFQPRADCPEELRTLDRKAVLEDADAFLAFLRSRFEPEIIVEWVERRAHELLRDPPAMQTFIVDHLRWMWEQVLESEWSRARPLVEETVRAFQIADLERMTDEQALRYVTGQSKEQILAKMAEAEEIIFVPSSHTGPYLGVFHAHGRLWIFFGCRQPQGAPEEITELRLAELLVWLSALADGTRLRMLDLARQRGEVCSQEFIEILGISQSSCSRHLRQLNAAGFLLERRTEAGKCYRLNPERLLETQRCLEAFAVAQPATA